MNLFEYFYQRKNVNKIINEEKISIGNSTDNYNIMLIASDFYARNNSIVIVLPNLFMAQKYYDMLSNHHLQIIDAEEQDEINHNFLYFQIYQNEL